MKEGLSLAQYAAKYGSTEQPEGERKQAAAIADGVKDRAAERETALSIKAGITRQLEQGAAPQTVLSSAIVCIALLTNDTEWNDRNHELLRQIYGDLEQQSLTTNQAAIEAERLQQRAEEYNRRLVKTLETRLHGCQRIEASISRLLQDLDRIEAGEDVDPV